MPPQPRPYPRANVRKIVKGHSQKTVSKGADALIYLDYVLFIRELMQHAEQRSKESDEKSVHARDIRKATLVIRDSAEFKTGALVAGSLLHGIVLGTPELHTMVEPEKVAALLSSSESNAAWIPTWRDVAREQSRSQPATRYARETLAISSGKCATGQRKPGQDPEAEEAGTTWHDSKTAKKRKPKAEQSVAAADSASHSSEPAPVATGHANGDSSTIDSPHIKELNRQIRNIHKKISASAKADAVIAENPGKSLDELVAEKKLNSDQKAQILKKPGLQTQVNQLEEQVSHYRAFFHEVEERFNREKAALIEAHQQEVARLRQEIEEQIQTPKAKDIDDELKVISHFLHAAASKRQSEDADSEEVRAFEGILLQIYQGNFTALTTLRNLIIGSEERVTDTENNLLDVTFAQVRTAALAESVETANLAEEEGSAPEPVQDETAAYSGLTELDSTAAATTQTNGGAASQSDALSPEASTADDAANPVAETAWNPEASTTTDGSANAEEWIHISNKPAETETNAPTSQPATLPAAQPPTQPAAQTESWAEEVSTSANEEKPKAENDGFEQVRTRHNEEAVAEATEARAGSEEAVVVDEEIALHERIGKGEETWDKSASRESSASRPSSSDDSEDKINDDSSDGDSADETGLGQEKAGASSALNGRSPAGSVKTRDRSRYGSGSGKYRVTGLYAERLQYWDTGHSRGLKPFGRTAKAMLVTYENVFGPAVEDLRLVLNARDHWGLARDITLPSRTTLANPQSSASLCFASSSGAPGAPHLEALLNTYGKRSRFSADPIGEALFEPSLVIGEPGDQATVKIPAQASAVRDDAATDVTKTDTNTQNAQCGYKTYSDISQPGWIIHSGRRINTLAWMPNSDNDQYLAIACKSPARERTNGPSGPVGEPSAFRPSVPWASNIDILHFPRVQESENEQSKLNVKTVPRLMTTTSLACGDVRQLTWSPGPFDGNIHILAALSSDGLVRLIVYKLEPEILTTIFKAEPSQNAVFSEIAWLTATDLVVGASDGSLRLYNALDPSKDSCIQPYLVSQLHDTYVLTLSPASPSSTPFYIASRSASGDMSLTDLRCPVQDRVDVPKGRVPPVKALVYAPFTGSWLTFGEASDNEMLQTTVECHHLRHFYGEVPVAKLSPLEGQGTALASSPHHPSILIGTARGTVFATNYLRTVIPTSVYQPEMDGYLQKVCEYQFQAGEGPSLPDTFHGRDVPVGTSFFTGPSHPVPLDDGTRKRRKNQTREAVATEQGGDDSIASMAYNDEQAVTAIAWNPNHKFAGWAAVGWGSGIIRVIDLSHDAS
ncbi:hypothetical protein DV735_g1971, partial [Chaetothyriales sp. CBS 134920]